MNCEQYREAIAADPSFDGGAGHLGECEACRAYRREMLELDRMIGRALAIDVPAPRVPELPDLDSGNVVALPRRRRTPALLAVAATALLAAFVGLRMFYPQPEYESLADQLLAHLDHEEPYATRVTDVPVSDERLAAIVPANVSSLDQRAGLITYAQSCEINGHQVPHLVMQGQRGPVTILLMPQETVSGPESFTGDNIKGVILPVGDGSIAIFGRQDEPLEPLETTVLNSVKWQT